MSRAHQLLRARPGARHPCVGDPLADGRGHDGHPDARLSWGGLGAGLAALLVLTYGCASVGPPSIVRDRFDYATAISESWKTQMLTNMVRIRYSEAPVFLNVESAINSYQRDFSVNTSGQIYPGSTPSSSVTLGGSASYGDHPTITYNPLVGDRFSKSLLTPLPPGVLLTLIQAGWNAEVLFRACVQSINGLQNHAGRLAVRREPDPKFVRLMELFGRIQRGGGMGVRVVGDKETGETIFYFTGPKPPEAIAADVAEAEKLLGLTVDTREFRAVYGLSPKDDHEVAILTRSMLEILLDLSTYVQVPPQHVAEHRALPGVEPVTKEGQLPPLIRVRSGDSLPATRDYLVGGVAVGSAGGPPPVAGGAAGGGA